MNWNRGNRKTRGWRSAFTYLALMLAMAGVVLSQVACESLPSSLAAKPVAAADGNRPKLRSYYVQVQPDATGLRSVDDDGENTFVEFNILPPGDLKFFDSLGKPLRAIWLRNMAALPGTFKGILLRLGTATSYISVNPQAELIRKPAMIETIQINELRELLMQEGPRKEMEQIAARIAAVEIGATGASKANDGAGALVDLRADAASRTVVTVGTGAVASTAKTPLNVSAPATGALAAAFNSTKASSDTDVTDNTWPRTQRVFFATKSVGISAPDDGLHRIVSDAKQSEEIWISGHTDSKGARTYNMLLAKRRAEAIKYILTSRGIAPERIIIVNAPVDTYIAANETEVGRSQNRRADVTFVRARSTATAARVGLITN